VQVPDSQPTSSLKQYPQANGPPGAVAQPPVVSWLVCPRKAASSRLSFSMSPVFANSGNDFAASTRASYVKKFAPEHAGLFMFGKNASKSAFVNQAEIGDEAGKGVGSTDGVGGFVVGDGVGLAGDGAAVTGCGDGVGVAGLPPH